MIEIRVRHTKKAQADPAIMAQLKRPMVLGEALARRVHERVSKGGDLATEAKRYKAEVQAEKRAGRLARNYDKYEQRIAFARSQGNHRKVAELTAKLRTIDNQQQKTGDNLKAYVVSDAYAGLLGLKQTRFSSSAAFHAAAGTKPGSFRVSGGMWQGLQVRNVGADAVLIDFAGSSLGGKRQSTTTKTGRTRSKPVAIRNQVKAGTVFHHSGVNVLQPKDTEIEAMVAGVCRWSQNMLGRVLGAAVGEFKTGGDQLLLRDILQHYDGTR